MKSIKFKQEVINLLNDTRIPMTKLAQMIGVSLRHLYKVKTGETVNPQVDELQLIYDWFLANPKARK